MAAHLEASIVVKKVRAQDAKRIHTHSKISRRLFILCRQYGPHQDLASSMDKSGERAPRSRIMGRTPGCETERLARDAAAEYWPSG